MSDYRQETESIFAFSVPQSNYATAVAPSSSPKNYRQFPKEGYDHAKLTLNAASDEGTANGAAYAKRRRKASWDVSFGGVIHYTPTELGIRAYDSFGDYSVVETVAGEVYTHTFKLLSPHAANELPARTLVDKIGEYAVSGNQLKDVKFPSMVNESIEFSNGGGAFLQGNTAYRGSGKIISPSGVQFWDTGRHVTNVDDMDETEFLATSGQLKVYPQASLAGSVFDTACDFRDMSISISQNPNTDIGYRGCPVYQTANTPSSGAVRNKMPIGKQTITASFTYLLTPATKAGFDAEALLVSGAEISMVFIYTGELIGTFASVNYYEKATFKILKGIVADTDIVTIDGLLGIRVTLEPLAIDDTMPLELELVSPVADFSVL